VEERNYSRGLTTKWQFGLLGANLRNQVYQPSKTWPLRGLCRQKTRRGSPLTSRVTEASQHLAEDQVEKTTRSEDAALKASSPRLIVQGLGDRTGLTRYLLFPRSLNRIGRMISTRRMAPITPTRTPDLPRIAAMRLPTTSKIPCRRLVYSQRNLLSSSNPQLYRVNEVPMIKGS